MRPLLDLTDGVLLGAGPRRLEKSRVKWRSRGYLDRQEVLHDYSEQSCALVGLFLIIVRCRRCLRVKQA